MRHTADGTKLFIIGCGRGTTTMTTIHAHEIRPGDVVEYGGRCHKITRVERHDGWAFPVAADDTGWAIALDRYMIPVHRATV